VCSVGAGRRSVGGGVGEFTVHLAVVQATTSSASSVSTHQQHVRCGQLQTQQQQQQQWMCD